MNLVLANDQDLWRRTIPAAACALQDNTQADKVRLDSTAGWEFYPAQINGIDNIGTITFYCPISLNNFSAAVGGMFGNDVDISGYRIYYRDTDGTGLDAQVTIRLNRWTMAGLFLTAGSTFNSNAFLPTDDTTIVHNVAHDVDSFALYSFRVTLKRNSTNQHPRFHGIDFLTTEPAG